MRAVALAILATSLSQAPALAADYDPGPLRGTAYAEPMAAPVVSWEGPYVGGFGGYAQTNFEFKGALRDPAARILRDLAIEQEFGLSRLLAAKSDDARSTAYGAFAGYNSQFEDVVLGVELDYTHARMIGVSTDSIGRSIVRSNGYFNSVDLSGLASANLNDYGSLRARLGYVTGPFMPLVTGGIALGRFDSTRTVYIDIQSTDTRTPRRPDLELVQTETIGPKETFVVGLTAGLGVDLALTQNIFLRAEYQYIHFDDFNGNKLNVNTVRRWSQGDRIWGDWLESVGEQDSTRWHHVGWQVVPWRSLRRFSRI